MTRKYPSASDFNLKNMKFFYGIPHAHTAFSTGKGSPLEAYEYAINRGLDFLIITDHNSYLIHKTPIKDTLLNSWRATNYYAQRIKRRYEHFLPIVGFEFKTDEFGDFNVVNSNTFFTGSIKDLNILPLWMLNNHDSFIAINHPHKYIDALKYSPILNKIITSIEVYNGTPPHKYTNHEKYYYNLLDKGWKLGAINGQDNHRINFGDSENLTCYVGNDLSKDSLIDAFRNHRTYSTESKTLKLFFTINDYYMGETLILKHSDKLKFNIFCEDSRFSIKELQIISNGGKSIAKIDNLKINSLKYLYEHEAQSESWFIVKVILSNDKVAVSSPVFLEYSTQKN